MHGTAIDDVLIFLLAAVVSVSLFKYLRISAVLGYLLVGSLIGPMAFGLVDNVKDIDALAEIGVVFLLFSIGLKMSFKQLQMLRNYVFGLGFLQFILTSASIMLICLFFGIAPMLSFVIASGFALSSTAVSMEVLKESGEISSRFGRVSFAILLAQDFAVILLLILDSTLSSNSGGGILETIGEAFIKAFGVLLIIGSFGRWVLRPVYKVIASFKSQELFSATSLLVVLGTSMLTAQAGLSMELGAFLAGVLIAETEYRHQVEADISPFAGLLLGLFFVSVGMKIDFRLLIEYLPVILGVIFGMIIVKVAIVFVLSLLFSLPKSVALRSSLILATGSEFLFILFAKSVEGGVMSQDIGNIFMVTIAISMALTPFLDMFGKFLEDRLISTESDVSMKSALKEVGDLKNHVIIAGFGRTGRLVAEILSRQMIPYVAIDNDMNNVSQGRSAGQQVFYGDARHTLVLKNLSIEKAKSLLICLDNENSAMMIASMVHHNFPNVSITARLQDEIFAEKLRKTGVYVVVPEIIEPSLKIASHTLEDFGLTNDEITSTIRACRDKINNNGLNEDYDESIENDDNQVGNSQIPEINLQSSSAILSSHNKVNSNEDGVDHIPANSSSREIATNSTNDSDIKINEEDDD